MQADAPMGFPDLERAIDRDFLAIAPDVPLLDAIALMSQSYATPGRVESAIASRASCVLIIEQGKAIGIFTERDLVRLTVAERALEGLTVAEVMSQPVVTLQESSFQDIFAALFLYRRYRIRHLPITNAAEYPIGVVSPDSIRQVLQPANLLKMRRVADVMSKKLICVPPSASVLDAAREMVAALVSCVAIVQQDEEERWEPLGIITERDLVQFKFLELDLAATTVREVMSSPLFLLSPEDSLWTAHQEMQKRRVRRLVVSWNWGRDLGIITQTSLLRAFDPMEMYWTVESLQQTVQQFQEKAEDSNLLLPEAAVSPFSPLLDSLRDSLEMLANDSEPSPESRQIRLQRAIADLGKLELLLHQ